jgi:RNA polymerase sigma-70 factor (ECF subfamily)
MLILQKNNIRFVDQTIDMRHGELSDEELIALVKADDHAAFNAIYDRYWKFLMQAAYQVSRHRADSLDVCQTVFLWFWENRATVRVSASLKGYLYNAVKYKLANLIRNGKVRENLFDKLKIIDVQTHKSNELELKQLESFIRQLIDDLPPRCRAVFLLSRDEQLSHKEIAERLDISEKTVEDHITRALTKLRGPLGRLATIFLYL